jgi:hypothetical protein
LAWQQAEGDFRIASQYEAVVWPTAMAVLSLHHLAVTPAEQSARDRATAWLLAHRGLTTQQTDTHREMLELDTTLVGWGWTEGQFSWVDPTAWSCLALRLSGHGAHPRVEEGLRLLLDRAYDEGGVNVGSRRVFGRMTEPVPANTAVFLLAFSGLPDQPRLHAARQFLLQEAAIQADLENLCWIRLAFAAWRADPEVAAAIPAVEERLRGASADPFFPHLRCP